MDTIFSIQRRPPKNVPNLKCLVGEVSLCTLSSNNLIAFTTVTELNDTTNDSWGSHVYVADLNTPWDSHKILSTCHQVTALEWDLPGRLLLVTDVSGSVYILACKEHLINQWTTIHTAYFPGEHILAAAFFHSGKKISLISEKKDSTLYNEKFGHLRFECSVKQFGGRPAEGALVVTATGMLGTVLLPHDGSTQSLTTDSLEFIRKHITAVDICYGKNGDFLIAVSGGSTNLPVQCYKVSVKKVDDHCAIISQALPSFFLQDSVKECVHVSHLRWVTREDADSLVVGVCGEISSMLQVWELRETSRPVHPLLASSSNSPENFNTVLWQHQSLFRNSSKLVSLTTSKLCVCNGVSPPSYVIAAFSDGSIHCLQRDGLRPVGSGGISPPFCPNISHIDISWLGHVLLATDTVGQTYLYRLQPITEPGGALTVPYATQVLEYCMVSGLSPLDLLIVLRPTMIEALCDRLTEGFNRQSQAVQQYYYVQYLYIKIALYRLSSQGQYRANDLTNLLMLHSVATAFKSLLRPSDMSSHDKSPADSLAAVMTGGENQTDVDKVLFHLEAKEFTVEPSTLQSLQQLIQWVSDLALHILARLPDSPRPSKPGGYDLSRDTKALNTLRELLVLVRIWGLLRPACLPVFHRSSESQDVLAHLFRLLSHLAHCPGEPDETLLDECCQLPSQVTIPQLNQYGPRIALTTPLLAQQSLPLQLEYGQEPDNLCYNGSDNGPVLGAHRQVVDCIRHAWLGRKPRFVRVCSRCGGRARAPPLTRSPTPRALRSWEQRWITSCKCGGLWRLQDKVDSFCLN